MFLIELPLQTLPKKLRLDWRLCAVHMWKYREDLIHTIYIYIIIHIYIHILIIYIYIYIHCIYIYIIHIYIVHRL